MVAGPLWDNQHSIDGAVLIPMVMAGLILHRTGWLVQGEWQTHGLKIRLNGMIPMVMAEGTILLVQPLTFVLLIQELQLGLVQVETVGAVQILMAMAGQT